MKPPERVAGTVRGAVAGPGHRPFGGRVEGPPERVVSGIGRGEDQAPHALPVAGRIGLSEVSAVGVAVEDHSALLKAERLADRLEVGGRLRGRVSLPPRSELPGTLLQAAPDADPSPLQPPAEERFRKPGSPLVDRDQFPAPEEWRHDRGQRLEGVGVGRGVAGPAFDEDDRASGGAARVAAPPDRETDLLLAGRGFAAHRRDRDVTTKQRPVGTDVALPKLRTGVSGVRTGQQGEQQGKEDPGGDRKASRPAGSDPDGSRQTLSRSWRTRPMSPTWSSIQSAGVREWMISFRPSARSRRSSGDMVNAR